MGIVKEPEPVMMFCGAIVAPGVDRDALWEELEREFGLIETASDYIPFDSTDYYRDEMGEKLEKVFFAFEDLVPPDRLPDIKLRTNEIELRHAADTAPVRRAVNLDPGYIELAKMVLATTKNNYHRIYLRDGMYAEVTLKFTNNSFRPFDWTYPDYRTDAYIDFFNNLRSIYKEKLKYSRRG